MKSARYRRGHAGVTTFGPSNAKGGVVFCSPLLLGKQVFSGYLVPWLVPHVSGVAQIFLGVSGK